MTKITSVRSKMPAIEETNQSWLDTQVPNRLVAAYQLGRLVNETDWHMQHCLFYVSPEDTECANDALARIQAVSFRLASDSPNRLEPIVNALRRTWKQSLCCEASADEVAACFADHDSLNCETPEERRHQLVVNWTKPLIAKLERNIRKDLSERERWAFELGRCLDQGVRRCDVHLFFEEHVSIENDGAQDSTEPFWFGESLKCRRTRASFRPGDLAPDSAWHHTLQELLAKVGISGAGGTVLSEWKFDGVSTEFKHTQKMVTVLDQSICERLAWDAEASDDTGEMEIKNRAPDHKFIVPESASLSRVQLPIPIARQERGRLLRIKKRIDPQDTYIGESAAILEVFDKIQTYNKNSSEPVLVLGPTGVGKTQIAKLIHQSSERSQKRYLEIQATDVTGQDAQIVRGQWQGIGKNSALPNIDKDGTTGWLQNCAGGTIFIDEVAELPGWFQTFLLRVIDRRSLAPACGQGPAFATDVRLILATNADLKLNVADGSFRNDLYERITARVLAIPQLKQRKEDIPLFVERERGKHRVSAKFLVALMRHDWEGSNIRQLLSHIRLAIDNTSSPKGALNVDSTHNLSIISEITPITEERAEEDIYCVLKDIFEAQGLEKGGGLHHRIAEILGRSDAWVSGVSKRVAQRKL